MIIKNNDNIIECVKFSHDRGDQTLQLRKRYHFETVFEIYLWN